MRRTAVWSYSIYHTLHSLVRWTFNMSVLQSCVMSYDDQDIMLVIDNYTEMQNLLFIP